jgi:hypothetical protein
MDETAHIGAKGPRAVFQELFATYGGKMPSLQAAGHVERNIVALRHLRSSGMDKTAHIRANGPRAVIQELFATYGGKMSSLQTAGHSTTSETAKRTQEHIHTCADNVAQHLLIVARNLQL